ncbi:MAG: DUF721 domain-containing protein [Bacteroidales bacterium]|nr:DUF721 domain-containing protein [Bacteroidales bacterium]MDD2425428.1 DUF721 domain-containing protein [Bacteroidales bacterium]MDD3988883.1 DUF721 domain-containing protein [Bacteroidales bacterium]MDD4638432.1 DUF721 domain-containing protein [Bacteroidales bacterium]
MKRENSVRIDELLTLFIKEYGLEDGLVRTRVFHAWDESVGPRYSKITVSKFFREGVLYCTINSSVAKNYLFMHRVKIIGEINRIMGSQVVKDLVLR